MDDVNRQCRSARDPSANNRARHPAKNCARANRTKRRSKGVSYFLGSLHLDIDGKPDGAVERRSACE